MNNHKYKINDIASLYSRAQWSKMQPLPDENYGYFGLFIPSLSDGIRLDVRMLRGEVQIQSGFVLVINDNFIELVDPYYLCFELMSLVGNVALLYDKETKNYKNRITKKDLGGFEIEIPEMERQLGLSLFTEVMDALSIEQVMGTFFSDMDIRIYDPWKRLLEKFDRKDKQYTNKLFGALISQDSEVMNGVRKVRIAVKNIAELYKKV